MDNIEIDWEVNKKIMDDMYKRAMLQRTLRSIYRHPYIKEENDYFIISESCDINSNIPCIKIKKKEFYNLIDENFKKINNYE